MAVELTMPRFSDEMKEGTISRWLKGPGEAVAKGEPIVEVETEKVIVEVEANAAGVIVEIVAQEHAIVPVGGLLCRIGNSGEAAAPAKAAPGRPSVAKSAPAPKVHAPPPARPAQVVSLPARSSAGAAAKNIAPVTPPGAAAGPVSPLARRVATELGIDLSGISGSGIGGKIILSDLQPFLPEGQEQPVPAAPPPARAVATTSPAGDGAYQDLPHSSTRRTIARRMAESKQTVPHFYMTAEVDVTDLLRERERLNRALPEQKVTVNDLIIKAAALALERVPDLNASWHEDAVRRYAQAHIGFAAAVDDGLVTPVVRDCHGKSLGRIAREARALAARAKARTLTAQDLAGATFTVSNLGMFDVVEFAAIINPPQVAILAVAQPQQKPVAVKGRLTIRSRMNVTVSCDHRALDGATAARFLKALKETLETPELVISG
jgi:pyruvate dehydrogenase E2 component (dihydrolipoamide acetyltransferase)